VLYLTTELKTGTSVVEPFAGGANPLREVGRWKTREEALDWLKKQDCEPFDPKRFDEEDQE
jgi:hypothetical protein